MRKIGENKSFGGNQERYEHESRVCNCTMTCSVFVPPQADDKGVSGEKLPVLYWLSGLTCTDENFVIKAGAQRFAAEHNLILVAPDTSPRGEEVADDASYDLGQGAGFYINATHAPWKQHYRMYDYITEELPELIARGFPADMSSQSIFGHSMGGHGALMIALKNPGRFKSVSAFAPIVAPSKVPWGQKVFTEYLGEAQSNESWQEWDSCALMEQAGEKLPILIDQGSNDEFLETHLKPELIEEVAQKTNWPLTLRRQCGYDHSYFFIASFMEDHFRFHAKHLFGKV